MILKSALLFAVLYFAVSGAVRASLLEQESSSYGFTTLTDSSQITPITDTCLNLNGTNANAYLSCGGFPMIGQTYFQNASQVSAGQSRAEIFDFKINSDVTDFTISLTGTEPFYNQAAGLFVCNPGADPNCTNSQVWFSTVDPLTLGVSSSSPGTNAAAFTVPGDGNGLVFFAVEPNGTGKVTADITLSDPAPEPGTLVLISLCLVAILSLRRPVLR
jgi:hypothetical protein